MDTTIKNVGGIKHRIRSRLKNSQALSTLSAAQLPFHAAIPTLTKRSFFRLFLLVFFLGPPLATWWVVFRKRPKTILEIARRIVLSVPKSAMDWLGRAKVAFTHSDSPLPLKQKDGSQTDLLKLVESSVPPCQLNPLLFNGHVQTFWTAQKVPGPPIYYKRKIFDANHKTYPGTFTVDFVTDKFEELNDRKLPIRTKYYEDEEWDAMHGDDDRPMLVVLHGLSGGSYEVYLREAIYPLVQSGKWEICVVNARGCAKSAITSGLLFNARATWDIRRVVSWIGESFPNRPLFAAGFSLGANILTNYVAEEGSECRLKAAVSCGNPFNLEVASKALARSLFGKEVYLRVMGTNLKKLINLHKKEIEMYTDLDMKRINNVTYLYEFDREVQCGTWGYPTEDAYYRDASSADSVLAIRIPFMALGALDDPIAVSEAIPYGEFKQNPCTVLCTTSLGGHLSWFEVGGGRWHAKPICNFFNRMAFEVDLDAISPQLAARITDRPNRGSHFDPMRRRLTIKEEEIL
ncbi:uncharacterized protein MKZ38_007924 [Zalerion maritima]|uniref:alcohol O-acetyltransferase n=1 Tax=Zalerion maritima TaxID=339359 RepID=A0AAD5RHI1_9PEZI|nr:uncharacterized protein MKZ38_007924 [Zalerion maritima]